MKDQCCETFEEVKQRYVDRYESFANVPGLFVFVNDMKVLLARIDELEALCENNQRIANEAQSALFQAGARIAELESAATMFDMILTDLKSTTAAGGILAEAAQRVVSTSDGIHRLGLSLAQWNQCLADCGGRGNMYRRDLPERSEA